MLAHELKAAEEYLEKQDFWLTVLPGRKDRMINSQATFERLNRVIEDRRALEECLPMARALFGERVETAVELLHRQFHLVGVAAEANSWEGNDSAFQRSVREDLFSGSDSRPNPMDTVIAAQVKLIEDECVPVLRLERKSSEIDGFGMALETSSLTGLRVAKRGLLPFAQPDRLGSAEDFDINYACAVRSPAFAEEVT